MGFNLSPQGTFPHGIDILTVADYFAVGSRPNAFLSISVHIAGHREYGEPLVRHLVDRKVGHWDVAVRELSARALHNLCRCEPEYMREEVVPRLLAEAVGRDLHLCHGATLAAGQVVAGLGQVATAGGQTLHQFLASEALVNKLWALVTSMVESHKLRGLGGELMRQAVSEYIRLVSQAGLEVPRAVAAAWLAVLEESLGSSEAAVQQAAVPALSPLLEHLLVRDGRLDTAARDRLVDAYIAKLAGAEVARKGYSAALGSLPARLLEGRQEEVLQGLIRCSRVTEGTEAWAEARRDGLRALAAVAATVVDTLDQKIVPHLYDSFLQGMEDYTIDRRGDTGAWVREAAMSGLEAVTLALLAAGADRVPSSILAQAFPCLAQQATEKIARTRGHAGKVFHTLLHARATDGAPVPGVPCRDTLELIFPADIDINWIVESETFPRFVKLLRLKEFSERMILGLTVSIGGLTERLVRNSSHSLFTELRDMDPAEVEAFTAQLLAVFRSHQKVDRVTMPLFKFLDQLLTSGCLDPVMDAPASSFPSQLFALCKAEISRSGDPNKLMSAGDVFCQLLQAADTATVHRCLTQLAILLCHRFPRVRKATAEKLYEALLTFGEAEVVPEEHLEQVMELLSDTKWEGAVEEVRPLRNRICELAGVPTPTTAPKPDK